MKASGGAAGGAEDSRLPDMAESPDTPSLEDAALVGEQGRGGSFTFQPRPSAGRGAEIQPPAPSEAARGGDPRQRHPQQSRMQEQLAAAASAASAAAGSVQGQLAAAADSAAAQLQQALPPPEQLPVPLARVYHALWRVPPSSSLPYPSSCLRLALASFSGFSDATGMEARARSHFRIHNRATQRAPPAPAHQLVLCESGVTMLCRGFHLRLQDTGANHHIPFAPSKCWLVQVFSTEADCIAGCSLPVCSKLFVWQPIGRDFTSRVSSQVVSMCDQPFRNQIHDTPLLCRAGPAR